jgi:hypothetical protein
VIQVNLPPAWRVQADSTGTVIEVINPSSMALGNAMQEDIGSATTSNNQQPRG